MLPLSCDGVRCVQVALNEAAELVLFLMDHCSLQFDHIALNETTFTWPERILPMVTVRLVS